jgi:hypothetical protein
MVIIRVISIYELRCFEISHPSQRGKGDARARTRYLEAWVARSPRAPTPAAEDPMSLFSFSVRAARGRAAATARGCVVAVRA